MLNFLFYARRKIAAFYMFRGKQNMFVQLKFCLELERICADWKKIFKKKKKKKITNWPFQPSKGL